MLICSAFRQYSNSFTFGYVAALCVNLKKLSNRSDQEPDGHWLISKDIVWRWEKLPEFSYTFFSDFSSVISLIAAISAVLQHCVLSFYFSSSEKVLGPSIQCQFDLKGRRTAPGAPPSHHSLPVRSQSSLQPQLDAHTPHTLTFSITYQL